MAIVVLATMLAAATQAQEFYWPSPDWENARPADRGLDARKLEAARRYAFSAGGSGMILRRGTAVMRWGDQDQRYDIKSATKSFGATMLGVAIMDGKIDLDALAQRYHPALGVPPQSNTGTDWLSEITILHLATQTAGFDKPGGYEKLLFQPGTRWHYSDGGPNWLAECITLEYRRDLQDVMFQRVFTPLGISRDDLRWRTNQYREARIEGIVRREFGAGIHANVKALSRLGYLYLRGGRWRDKQILSEDFVKIATTPIKSVVGLPEWTGPHDSGEADSDTKNSHASRTSSDHYGLLWWNNQDGALPKVPRDAFWAWGLYDSLVVVIPSLDMVVVRGGERGKQWPRQQGQDRYRVLEPFLNPIVAAVDSSPAVTTPPELPGVGRHAPYPPSSVVTAIDWAPPETIVRLAKGSDNWPLTWADDDHLYTAYGDGWGFEPRVEKKLSLGLAMLTGGPADFRAVNVRSASGEQVGQGAAGKKASGILMVDGVLYMWVRNAANSQLAWSDDRGKNWQWADWKWTTSFGCPTFLNFGKNYSGARDDYVYIYSHDNDSAYEEADRMVMARVQQTRIGQREAYEFFCGLDPDGRPTWSRDLNERGAVFMHLRRCYRSGITYNAGLKRYLWCQVLPESSHRQGQRFQGGFGIYDAAEPWGPWTTVYFTEDWDVGPGETNSLPTKWISEDGLTIHLVFSGDDHFSVRRATLTIAPES